jgi:hypothetical protein
MAVGSHTDKLEKLIRTHQQALEEFSMSPSEDTLVELSAVEVLTAMLRISSDELDEAQKKLKDHGEQLATLARMLGDKATELKETTRALDQVKLDQAKSEARHLRVRAGIVASFRHALESLQPADQQVAKDAFQRAIGTELQKMKQEEEEEAANGKK